MTRKFTPKFVALILMCAFCWLGRAYAQAPASNSKKDTTIVTIPLTRPQTNGLRLKQGIFDTIPANLVRTIEYDPITNRYILYEKVGDLLYRPPQYLTFDEYLNMMMRENERNYFKKLSGDYTYKSAQPGFIPTISIRNKSFEQIFGGSDINIRPQGSAEAILSGQINKNDNPLFNSIQRSQFNFNLDQKIQLNVTGTVGDKLKITTNYNTDAQFQFENQIKLDYTGHADEIIQKIELGTVSMPLPTTLITGSQALFGVKTKLKFGKLNVTSIFSQQRSQPQTITITNGSQQGSFQITSADYDANRHFFLSQFFRNNYNKALANIPIISSNVNITKIEVWVTNRVNSTTNSRDVLAFLDLGENQPYNTRLVQGGPGFSGLPAGTTTPGFTQQSNSLLRGLPANSRLTFDPQNSVASYFASSGGSDNFAKLVYARQLQPTEYTLHSQLGYITLKSPLNSDEVLAVAYQYTYNGVQYQVGEFSSDQPVDPTTRKVLYVKLLKNELLKTSLPTWNLMMKNIYSLNASQISPNNFKLRITRLDDKSGIEKEAMDDGQNTKGKLWLQLTDLDNLDAQQNKTPDGYFDFLDGITIDPNNGVIIFPTLEPFGADLASRFTASESDLVKRYTYQPLYDSTQYTAKQYFQNLNRYTISGTFSGTSGSTYQLNAVNIPQGSVVVNAGATTLVEGTDFTIDYNAGRITILNSALLASGQPITVKVENNELFGVQQKSLFGSRFDYQVDDKLSLGATIMHLTEQPITQNEIIGQESISNTMIGFDANYNSPSRFLTKLVDRIPFVHTKVPSSVSFNGEFAKLLPGNPSALNFAGSKNGTAYLDDFESAESYIDLSSASTWYIAPVPNELGTNLAWSNDYNYFNDLSYGYHRARLAFYNIDPIFYTGGTIPVTRNELSSNYVRQVLQTEVFPFKQSPTGQPLPIATFDLAYYPMTRGPYNYRTNGLNSDGTLQNPQSNWGGIFRGINSSDFQDLNVQYIEFWLMDPYSYKPNSAGGDMYIDLGDISEDILKDGQKSLENGLPVDGTTNNTTTTVWGREPTIQPVVNSFDSDPASRALQDIGLDGLNDAAERVQFANAVTQVRGQVNSTAAATFAADPSSDDYQYYQGPQLDKAGAGILQRYSQYNGTEGNSPTSQQSQALLGLQTSASTALPDGEDVNHDNNMDQDDNYFEYHISLQPSKLVVGQNNIIDVQQAQVVLANGSTTKVNWYQFRIPITSHDKIVGGIQDFKSIRYMRTFLTGFADTTILRFATLQLVRGTWTAFNIQNDPTLVLADPALGQSPPLDNSTEDVETVNIEENGTRSPIPYVVPPGIQRQPDYSNLQVNTKLNEQSLSVAVNNLADGYSRAAFKLFNNDLRQYKELDMFIHAEGSNLKNNDLNGFIRLGSDYVNNYYQYEIPLQVTPPGTADPNAIWPAANEIALQISALTKAKLDRDFIAKFNGKPWPLTLPYSETDSKGNIVTVVGNPDLGMVSTIMLGVRNPLKGTSNTDDGLAKSAIIWFDELRMTNFNEQGGWAVVGKGEVKLADFADISVAGNHSTAGFGTLDSRMEDRSLNDVTGYSVTANVELGKFLPAKSGWHIPAYVSVSNQTSTPEYDPATGDILLKDEMNKVPSQHVRDSIKNAAEDYTERKSFNLTNVRKTKSDPKAKSHFYDIENWNATVSYAEYEHHDFITLNDLEKTYKVAFAYNFTNQPKYHSPFDKIIKSNSLKLLKDINYSLWPSRLNFSISFDRFYSQNTARNNDPQDSIITPTTFNKTFTVTRIYGLGWNLTKSFSVDFDATNLSTVDEPAGTLSGMKMDTLWHNLLNLGRTTNYNHTINFTYNVPLNKIPYMDWVTLTSHYSTHFNWQGQPLFAIDDPQFDVGNSIQNSRTIQLDPTLNFETLYKKFPFIKTAMSPDNTNGLTKFLVGALTSVKTASVSFTRTDGTFIPGYLPQSNFVGEDMNYGAPGLGFLLGGQGDLRATAIAHGWISTDTLQNQLYVTTFNENLQYKTTIQPIKDLRIDITGLKTQDHTYQTNFKSLDGTNNIQSYNPVTSGDYSVSFISIGTAFSKISGANNNSAAFQKFEDDRAVISKRLGAQNPNSTGQPVNGYADGYSAVSQNVLVPAFIAAYTGKNPATSTLSQFPAIPLPNWHITYNGLSHIPMFSDIFESFDVNHGYSSSYTVTGYTTLLQYSQVNGAVNSRDANNDFLPQDQFSAITIFEQFVPLLGVNGRFKNGVTASLEYRKSRALSLSVLNSQLTQLNQSAFVFGFGYHDKNFTFPFGLFASRQHNDVNFKVDFSIQDTKTLIYTADQVGSQVSAGAQNIIVRPSMDWLLSQRFTLNLFYDSNITRPYTSQTFNTAFTNFGINLKLLLQ